MSELPLTPFPPPAGLAMVGGEDAGMCVDGVCAVPSGDVAAPSGHGEAGPEAESQPTR